MQEFHFVISEEEEGQRVDKVASLLLPDQSRSYLQKLLKDGNLLLNEKNAKPSARVSEGDALHIILPDHVMADITPEDIPLSVLYEDEDVLVINKPKGMVVHPAPGHASGTLVNAVMYHCGEHLSGINGIMRPGIVHRIDRDTTGSLIICKNDKAHQSIAGQLKEHSIVRKYYAICYGVVKEDAITIDKPIGRDPKERKRMAVTDAMHGKQAVTHVKVLERFNGFTYVECQLETGRTHQIRVHMASIGHPLLGDEVYAPGRKSPFAKLEGQCLHAGVLGFCHPATGDYLETTAPLPDYFTSLLKKLRAQSR